MKTFIQIQNFPKTPKFWKKNIFLRKFRIFTKNYYFTRESQLSWNFVNFHRNLKFWIKLEMFAKFWNFWQFWKFLLKFQILAKKLKIWLFCQNLKLLKNRNLEWNWNFTKILTFSPKFQTFAEIRHFRRNSKFLMKLKTPDAIWNVR